MEGDHAYNPNFDINDDGKIDIFDAVAAAGNYGESWLSKKPINREIRNVGTRYDSVAGPSVKQTFCLCICIMRYSAPYTRAQSQFSLGIDSCEM